MRTYRKRIDICEESLESQAKARRYNPAMVATFRYRHKNHEITLDAGTSDRIRFFHEDQFFIVLSANWRLDYVGIQVYDMDNQWETAKAFFQGEEQYKELLGPKGLDLSDVTIASRLFSYCMEVSC